MNDSDKSLLLDELISQKENQTCDFKRSEILSDSTKLAKLMTSFANSTGGRILIGVCDDGTLEGMKAKKEHEAHIMNIARDRCDPPLVPAFSFITRTEGDVYIVKILRYRLLPHAVKTGEERAYYIRVGSTVRGATSTELALLFESSKQETIKKPKLELLLVDHTGKAAKEIHAEPTFVKIEEIKVKRHIIPPGIPALGLAMQNLASLSAMSMASSFVEREPAEDLITIGIEVSNTGEAPAHEVRIELQFPENCKLLEKRDAIGGSPILGGNSRGLYVDDEDTSVARGRIIVLGNDLTVREFDEIYVRFPEMEQTYEVYATVKQHNFPPEVFEFSVAVKPLIRREVKHVYEDDYKVQVKHISEDDSKES